MAQETGFKSYQRLKKLVLEASLLNTQQYKVQIKGKVEQSREWSNTLPHTSGVVAIEKGAFRLLSTTVANFTFYIKAKTDNT